MAEALLALDLLIFGNTFDSSYPFHQIQVASLTVLGGIGWLAVIRRPTAIPPIPLLAPLPILGGQAITSILSPYPSLSWFATWQCASYVGIIWLLTLQAMRPVGRRNLVAAAGMVAVVLIAAYLLEVVTDWRAWLNLGFPLKSLPLRPMGSGGLLEIPTWLADVIAISIPAASVSIWLAGRRAIASLLVVVALTALVITGVRSVLLFALAAIAVVGFVWIRPKLGQRTALATTVLGGIGIAAGVGFTMLSSRSFDEGRLSVYASASTRFLESPIFGSGPDTFGVRRMSDTIDAVGHLAFPDAHNLLLTTAAESGLIGLIALAASIACYLVAIRRAWLTDPAARPVQLALLVGIGIIAGHVLVDVVFALAGMVVITLAFVAAAAAHASPDPVDQRGRSRSRDVVLIAGLAVAIVSTALTARSELVHAAVAGADDEIATAPAIALATARDATAQASDFVPGWWVRMLADDRTGDTADAIESARRLTTLEGFGQEWLALAILAGRTGDTQLANDSLARARAHLPVDPVVELNAAIIDLAAGQPDQAKEPAAQLLLVQPDIEPILKGAPSGLATLVASIRDSTARGGLAAGGVETAMIIALSGEDQSLASSLADAVQGPDATRWKTIVAAWFGDGSARSTLDAAAKASPSTSWLMWSWRLAARACDGPAAADWASALGIGSTVQPQIPSNLGHAPEFEASLLPNDYPGVVWRTDHPTSPYVTGTWTYSMGSPDCLATG
jgi:O-antigen ligase